MGSAPDICKTRVALLKTLEAVQAKLQVYLQYYFFAVALSDSQEVVLKVDLQLRQHRSKSLLQEGNAGFADVGGAPYVVFEHGRECTRMHVGRHRNGSLPG